MKIIKKETTYKSGPNKDVTTTQYKCSNENYSIYVSTIIGCENFALTFASTHVGEYENIGDAFTAASDILSCIEKPDIIEMRKLVNQ